MAGHYAHPDTLFPQYFAPPDAEKAEQEAQARGDDVVYDYSDVVWDIPSTDGEQSDPEADLRLLQSMGANLHLALGEEDETAWTPEPAPTYDEVLQESDEREWL